MRRRRRPHHSIHQENDGAQQFRRLILIAANFHSRRKQEFDVSNFVPNPAGEIVLSTLRRNEGEPFERTLKLDKEEGLLIRLKPA